MVLWLEQPTVDIEDVGSILPTAAVSKLGNFVNTTLPVSFGRDSELPSIRCLFQEMEKTPQRGKRVTCRGLT